MAAAAACLGILQSSGAAEQAQAAAPRWRIDIHHHPTNLAPGGEGQIWFELDNVGDASTSAPITLRIELAGLVGSSISPAQGLAGNPSWDCSEAFEEAPITCTTKAPVGRHVRVSGPILLVKAPPAPADGIVFATISGGGAANSHSSTERVSVVGTAATFGLLSESVLASFLSANQEPSLAAGNHPFAAIFGFDLNTIEAPVPDDPHRVAPSGNLRSFSVDLPPGFVGNPQAVGSCSPAQLISEACPASSQVGRVDLFSYPNYGSFDFRTFPVFNLEHPRGAVADLAFMRNEAPVHFKLSLDPTRDYAVTAQASYLNETLPLYSMRLTLWGVPADTAHDSERCQLPVTTSSCQSGLPERPFLTLPATCGGASESVRFRSYDSWQRPGLFGPPVELSLPSRHGCESLRFEPALALSPSPGSAATGPTGLDLRFTLPQPLGAAARGTSPIKDVEVDFPSSLQLSVAAATGLSSCSSGEIGLGSNEPAKCPRTALLGAASIETPLLPSPLEGSIYLADPRDNPTGGRYAFYLVASDSEERGVRLKLPGRLQVGPTSGQLVASFVGLPQLPIEAVRLRFGGGPRSIFALRDSCGPQVARAAFFSWAQPGVAVETSARFETETEEGCGRSGFDPRLNAGTVDPLAGASTPFVLRLQREDRDQDLDRFSLTLPPGVGARLAGVDVCPDPVASSGSCPPGSRIGYATAELGAGAEPLLVPGSAGGSHVYLAGPYRGAPYSLVVEVPARAGPFDLGQMVVRARLGVVGRKARIRIDSDPLPQRLEGIRLDYRRLTVVLDRPGFVSNPTSCRAQQVEGSVFSVGGETAKVADRFQVGGCARLGLRPRLSVELAGRPSRNGHPSLSFKLRPRAGDANLRSVAVTLPRGQLLDPTRLAAVCPATALAARACSGRTVKGRALVSSPLLPAPLKGPVVLAESEGKYPHLVALLRGAVDLEVVTRLTVSGGRLRAVAALPDLPLSHARIKLGGGRRGLFVSSDDLCRPRTQTRLVLLAYNGRQHELEPPAFASCR